MGQEKNYFRIVVLLFSVVTISVILWKTYVFFNELKESERKKMEIWVAALTELIDKDLNESVSQLALDIVGSNASTPMILYSHNENIYDPQNIPVDEAATPQQIEQLVKRFQAEYKPLEVVYECEVYSTVYYGNSPTINRLKYYPAAILLIILLFVIMVYFFYRIQKTAEQNKLWAGMAKETAHQIGTPLSSLVGWMEILRSENTNPHYVTEMEKDIHRLQTITERFSKIGSMPNLEKTDIIEETRNAIEYLEYRNSKLITFEHDFPSTAIFVDLNKQLYNWAIENLVKNAIDAMKGKGGIKIAIEQNTKTVKVFISDTGKGISSKNYKKIFKPGFTTKKRGWGLGLSLTRRIIEDYHSG